MSRSLEGALRELRRGVDAVPDAASEAARRERIGSRVMELQRELERRDRNRRRAGGALLAAAALVVAAITLLRDPSEPTITMSPDAVRLDVVGGRVTLRADGAVTSMDHGGVAVSRDTVIAAEGSAAVLRLASSTALELARASRVQLSAGASPDGARRERVRLLAGRVDLDVPKLASDGALAVETHDAVVEVRGTRFAVSVVEREPLAPFTQVDVSEGRVRIRLEDGVHDVEAGESWRSSDAEPRPEPAVQAQVEPEVVAPPAPNPPEPRAKAPAALEKAVSPSELAAQNRLLEAAELARKSKMPELALERFERLIELYPDADLAQNARVARFRLLSEMGRRDDSARAARDYLAKHPRGFAAGEARRLLEREDTSPP